MTSDPEAKFFVSAQWDILDRQHGAGMDGQFETLEQASAFILEQGFDTATIRRGPHEGQLIERGGVAGWWFPTLEQFTPLVKEVQGD